MWDGGGVGDVRDVCDGGGGVADMWVWFDESYAFVSE